MQQTAHYHKTTAFHSAHHVLVSDNRGRALSHIVADSHLQSYFTCHSIKYNIVNGSTLIGIPGPCFSKISVWENISSHKISQQGGNLGKIEEHGENRLSYFSNIFSCLIIFLLSQDISGFLEKKSGPQKKKLGVLQEDS